MTVAVLINKRARRGSDKLAHLVRRFLPRAHLAVTSTLDDCRSWIRELRRDPPALLLSGGGDGTTTALLNELRDEGVPFPAIGVLPLGTGNAWARVTGAPSAKEGIQLIARLDSLPPPLRSFRLVKVNGLRLAPFSGTGFDADLVADYKAQLSLQPTDALKHAHSGLRGYLAALFTRTVPRHLFGEGSAHVRIVNLGGHAETLDAQGNIVRIPGGEEGAVLYEGLAGVAGAATIPEWGFNFKAFPHAEARDGRLSVRVYGAKALQAVRQMFNLWKGADVPLMHDFFVDKVRMEFDREVPLQFAGDVEGMHRSLTFELADETVSLVDWKKLSAP